MLQVPKAKTAKKTAHSNSWWISNSNGCICNGEKEKSNCCTDLRKQTLKHKSINQSVTHYHSQYEEHLFKKNALLFTNIRNCSSCL